MMNKNCQNCKYWSFDMDMDAICTHQNANSWGTNINVMRGYIKTKNMRGEPCGPEGRFFKEAKDQFSISAA